MAPPREGSRRSLFEAVECAALEAFADRAARGRPLGDRGGTVNLDYHVAVERNFYSVSMALARKRVDVFVTRSGVQIFHRGERAASHARVAGQNHWTTLKRTHATGAQRCGQADAGLGGRPSCQGRCGHFGLRRAVADGARSCRAGCAVLASAFCAWRRDDSGDQLEAACVRAMAAAGASSSGFVEHLLKSGSATRRRRG